MNFLLGAVAIFFLATSILLFLAWQRAQGKVRTLELQRVAASSEVEKQLALMRQEVQLAQKQMQDWEALRAESTQAAKASVMEAGNKLSSKLLEDHKREAEAAKKQAEEAAKKNAENLMTQVTSLTQSVAAIREQTGKASEKMATVWRALTTPAGAGHLAEVGLENTLKNLGLEAGRDYAMQYATGTGGLRPDAVVYLPQDMVMVIDSKASKFLLEIAEAEQNGGDASALHAGLAQTMNKHLNDLKTKDYESAIRAAYAQGGRANAISATHIVMYVPSEGVIAHIKKADPEFLQKAEKKGVIVASPSGLLGLLSLAKHNIGLVRQSENHELIIRNVQQLMDNVITMLTYAEKVGRGLKSASDSYEQFSRSVNRNVLSKMRQLAASGVRPAKNKELPNKLIGLDVRLSEDLLTIEGEAELVEEPVVLEEFARKKLPA